MSMFQPATRKKLRLRMGLDGPSGSGKSLTGLRFAFAFRDRKPDARIAVIEAGESGGVLCYQGQTWDGHKFDFDIATLAGNYAPTEYTRSIISAGQEGYDVLFVDSLSHAWAGEGGALSLKDAASANERGNDWSAWRTVTPLHNRMIDAIMQSPCHVIVTMRSKTIYVPEEYTNDRGQKKTRIVKKGMEPIQRPGMEYEFTCYGSMDQETHTLRISKTRGCTAIDGAVIVKPGAAFMHPIFDWLETGESTPLPEIPRLLDAAGIGEVEELAKQAGLTEEFLMQGLRRFGVAALSDLTTVQAEEMKKKLHQMIARNAQKPNGPTNPVPSAKE